MAIRHAPSIALALLVLQNTSLVLLMRYSLRVHDDAPAYLTSTAVTVMEVSNVLLVSGPVGKILLVYISAGVSAHLGKSGTCSVTVAYLYRKFVWRNTTVYGEQKSILLRSIIIMIRYRTARIGTVQHDDTAHVYRPYIDFFTCPSCILLYDADGVGIFLADDVQ